MKIRPTKHDDIPALQKVLEGTELFPAEILPDMLSGFLQSETPQDIWLTAETEGTATGLCYAAPEMLTEGTWNMRAIAVLPGVQGNGQGAAMTQHLEQMLAAQGQRVLVVDTSGTEDFADTRAFYLGQGYTHEATIRDFWAAGDDKVIFRKALG